MSSSCLKRLGPLVALPAVRNVGAALSRGRRRHLHVAVMRLGTKASVAAGPFDPHAIDAAQDAAKDAVHSLLESSRMGVNDIFLRSIGLEVKRAAPKQTPGGARELEGKVQDRVPRGQDSSFWQPYSSFSPFGNRAKYLEQFARYVEHLDDDDHNFINGACTVVPEEEIQDYVNVLLEDGSLKSCSSMPAMFIPKTVYATVVKIALRTLQTTLDMVNGQTILGRQVHLFKRHSIRGKLKVAKRLPVDERVVHKLVTRVMEDHEVDEIFMGMEMQRHLYHNVITLIFRLVFDLFESFQLRCLGHAVTIHIQPDDCLIDAPGWDIPLDQGIFGRFDDKSKKAFAADMVTDLLNDPRINLPHVPDVFERKIYENVVMVLLQLVETAGTHMELHVAAMAFRPATDKMVKEHQRQQRPPHA